MRFREPEGCSYPGAARGGGTRSSRRCVAAAVSRPLTDKVNAARRNSPPSFDAAPFPTDGQSGDEAASEPLATLRMCTPLPCPQCRRFSQQAKQPRTQRSCDLKREIRAGHASLERLASDARAVMVDRHSASSAACSPRVVRVPQDEKAAGLSATGDGLCETISASLAGGRRAKGYGQKGHDSQRGTIQELAPLQTKKPPRDSERLLRGESV